MWDPIAGRKPSGSRRRLLHGWALFLIFAFPAAGLIYGQDASTGAVAGTVTDPSGAVVVGAQVRTTNEGTGEMRRVVSRQDGSYLVPLLPPGKYR